MMTLAGSLQRKSSYTTYSRIQSFHGSHCEKRSVYVGVGPLWSGIDMVGMLFIYSQTQLGHGDRIDQPFPKLVDSMCELSIVMINAGGFQSAAITSIQICLCSL